MSNARDQFADDIYTADRLHKDDPVDLTTHYSYVIADELIAAGYRKPRVIATAKELDALPVGSVIRTAGDEDRFDPRVAVKTGFWLSESEWEVADADDFCLDSGELDDLPATVLHEPEGQK